jgi:transcriptional regulator with XRE-family HTH domain
MAKRKARWEEAGYSDIIGATRRGDNVEVRFRNGDSATLPATVLGLPGGGFEVVVDSDDPTRLRLKTAQETQDIDWMQIRSAIDPEFARELRERDAEESRRLGRRMKALREDRGLSQREVARRVGMTPPQLSKIENGETDMRLSTVRSLLRAMNAGFADIAGPDAPEVSLRELRKRAERAGVPRDIFERISSVVARSDVPRVLERAFGWSRDALLMGTPRTEKPGLAVQFKAAAKQQPHESPLLQLALAVSKATAAAVGERPVRTVPQDPNVIRRKAASAGGKITLPGLLDWIWKAGLPVIPLRGAGGFSAVAWIVETTPMIVLKESRELTPFWLFDLAHELGHIALGHAQRRGIVDLESPYYQEAADQQEAKATDYALKLLIPQHTELLRAVRIETRGNYLRLKGAIEKVAREAGQSPGLLGMIVAREFEDIGEPKDRWGSATNLAKPEGSGRRAVEQNFARHVRLEVLPHLDAALLRAAALPED